MKNGIIIVIILMLLISCQTTRGTVSFFEEQLHLSDDSVVYFYRVNNFQNSTAMVEIIIIGEENRFFSQISMEGYLPIHLAPGKYIIEFHSRSGFGNYNYNRASRFEKITLNITDNSYRYIKIDGFAAYELEEGLALHELKEMRHEVYSWEKRPIEAWRSEWRDNWKNRENAD